MAFKEIEKFNDALLAKQVWRLINIPNSLCQCVFKARFFPDCSILEARESIVGSYAWKSLLSARDVIRQGMIWRVGNGESVRIKGDRWLPNQACCSVILPLPQLADDTRVSFLINQDRFAWKESVVKEFFLPHEADIILGIPLSFQHPPNHIAWAHTPSSMFSTSSAYKLIVSSASTSTIGNSNLDNQRKFWKGLW